MNDKKNISKLASLTIDKNGKLNKKVAEFALSNLSRRDLAKYLRGLKKIISANFVTIYHGNALSDSFKIQLERKFGKANVIFQKNDEIRNGIKVSHNDTIIDLSVSGYVTNTLNKLVS